MTLSDAWYACTAFKSDRYTDTDFLAVIQQYEYLKMYWQNPDAFAHHIIIGKF